MRPGLATAVLFTVTLFSSAPAEATAIVTYEFNSGSTAGTLGPNVSASAFAAGDGLANVDFTGNYAAARGWNPSNSEVDALAREDFWTFSVSANAGYQFDLTSLTLDEMTQVKGPLKFNVYSNNTLVGSELLTSTPSFQSRTLPLSGYNDLTNVIIQLVAWDGHDNGDTANWFVDNVILNGTIEPKVVTTPTGELDPVPEPASLVLLGTGLLAGAWRMRKRPSTSV